MPDCKRSLHALRAAVALQCVTLQQQLLVAALTCARRRPWSLSLVIFFLVRV